MTDIGDDDEIYISGKTRQPRGKKPRGFEWLYLTKPRAASMEMWDRIDSYYWYRYPLRMFLTDGLRTMYGRFVNGTLSRAAWWVKHRTTHQFHVIRPATLKPGWWGESEQMLHTMFHIFVGKVKWDYAQGQADIVGTIRRSHAACDPDQTVFAEEVIALYEWWTNVYPNRPNPWEKRTAELKKMPAVAPWRSWFKAWRGRRAKFDLSTYEEANAEQEVYDAEDQAMFERLAKLRGTMR
jgi:hypothetical protein